MRDVEEALVEGAVLTVLVVFLFLNSWRSTVITGLALPVSVLASFIAVWAFGFTLNTMSLLGLSLAIGILIDDAIVVRENIVRHVEMGKDHYHRRARGHRRDRPGGRGDDVLDRRGVRADRVHGRRRAAVVQAVRADDRLLGAGVAVRVVLARSDAVGVLAGPASGRSSGGRGSRACCDASTRGSTAQAERYKGVDRAGRSTTGSRWSALAVALVRRRAGAAGARAWSAPSSSRQTDDSEFNITLETPPGSNLDVHAR